MQPRTILVIDDDASIRQLLRLVLEDEGFRVVVAGDGREALRLLERDRPDLILLDLVMPVMDGRAFYRELRLNGGSGPPVIIVSAVGAAGARRELGAEAAIDKPFDLDELLGEVERLVGADDR